MSKSNKQRQENNSDLIRRNAEMAEGQSPAKSAQIFKQGNKYYCAECHSELPLHQDCPSCHAHVDWDRIQIEGR